MKNATSKSALTLLAVLTISLSFFSTAYATKYSTVKNGNWADNTVWSSGISGPQNITMNDTVEINHRINTNNIRINNGGTLLVKEQLNANSIVLSGTNSRIIVSGAGEMNAPEIQGNPNQIIFENNGPLPVTLLSFGLQQTGQNQTTNTLIWRTAQEINNAYFAVEKSADARNFTEAGRVEGKNTTAVSAYSFEDKTPFARTYYRLKQVDLDGTTTYSPVIFAERKQNFSVKGRQVTFSQPFTGTLRLFSMAGSEVKTVQLREEASYDLPENLHGIFILYTETLNQAGSQRIML